MEFFKIRRDIPFMRYALLFNIISALTFLAAVGFLIAKGLHFSIEFTGGTLIEVAYEKGADVERIRTLLDKAGYTDTTVQNFGSSRDVLIRLPAPRCFVMGDIGELGEAADALHAEVGEYAQARGIDLLLTLGEASRHAAVACGAGGKHFDSIDELYEFLDRQLPSGASVLVKGSRFMRMERVVEHLMQQFREEQ